MRSPHKPGLALVASLAAFACLPGAAFGGLIEEPEKPRLASTGNDGELVEEVPIATAPGLAERTAFTLGPEELPRLAAGDRLRVGAEVQVSTTCAFESERCIGRLYGYAPQVYARIELAPAPGIAAAPLALSATEEVKCKQRRPNRNHHCTIALENTEAAIADPATLPCEPNACYVNVIVGAHHPQAQDGNVVVLGADRPDGSVAQDKGRLNVIHRRGSVSEPTDASSSFLINPDLPLTEGKQVKRRVVFTVELPPMKAGDVLAIDGSYVADIDRLRFNTYLGSRLIVADSPHATEPAGVAKTATKLGGDASESNGFNCTQGPSGYSSPCTVEKTGAIRFEQDAVDSLGLPVQLYVNLVASAKALLTNKVKPKHRVVLAGAGGLRVARFTP